MLDEVTTPGNAPVVAGPNAPWACLPMASPMSCTHPATTLDPGEWVELKLGFAPGPGWDWSFIRNCAAYDYTASGKPEVFGSTDNDRACARIPICRRGDPECDPPVEKKADLRIIKGSRSLVCTSDGVCSFNIRVFNNGTENYVGPLTVIDEYPTGAPASSTFAPIPPWACGPIGAGQFQCDHPGVVLVPGAFVSLSVRAVAGDNYGDLIRNCAEVQTIADETDLANNRDCAEMRVPGRDPGRPPIQVEKTGDKECRVGLPCTFEVTITNGGTSGFSGPVRIGDAIGVDGIGRLEGVEITEIVPPLGCSPEPTTLPMSCVADLTLGAGESRVHQVTVVIPGDGALASMTAPVPARNCVGVVPPDTPVASAERMMSEAPATTGRPGEGPYACHSFTLSKQVVAQCSAGFVMNADGRCVCPEGTTFRNGQCRPVGGEPPPPPPPLVEECKLLPGQIRTESGRCICPRGTELVKRRCVKDEPPLVQCKLLPGQIRLDNGRCVCPRGTSLVRGECRKDQVQCKLLPGQIRLDNGRCVCPRGTSIIRGACRKTQAEPERCPRGTVGTPPNCRRLQISPDLQRLIDPSQRQKIQ